MTKKSKSPFDIFRNGLFFGMDLGNMGLRLSQAPRLGGIHDAIMRERLADFRFDPVMDVGLEFSPSDPSDDIVPTLAHLQVGYTGDPAAENAELFGSLSRRLLELGAQDKLDQYVETYRTPNSRDVFVQRSHFCELIEFLSKRPEILKSVLATAEEHLVRPDPIRVQTETGFGPVSPKDLERFFINFPSYGKRTATMLKRSSDPALELMDPIAVNRKISKQLGVLLDVRLGELVPLSDQDLACAYAHVDLCALHEVPYVIVRSQPGIGREMQGARWSNDVDVALSRLPSKWASVPCDDEAIAA